MAARRIPGAAVVRDPAAFSLSAGDGRLGYLLYRRALTRRLIIPRILRGIFAATPAAEPELLADLPPMLDRIDAWIADGILGGSQLNAADFMVAPSLALILYRPDVMPMLEGRPALDLVDRLLPEPAQAQPHALPSHRAPAFQDQREIGGRSKIGGRGIEVARFVAPRGTPCIARGAIERPSIRFCVVPPSSRLPVPLRNAPICRACQWSQPGSNR
jgi:hypothetical protein